MNHEYPIMNHKSDERNFWDRKKICQTGAKEEDINELIQKQYIPNDEKEMTIS